MVMITWEGCSRHLLGRGQGCCSTSYNTQEAPTVRNDLAHHVNSAEVEKPALAREMFF